MNNILIFLNLELILILIILGIFCIYLTEKIYYKVYLHKNYIILVILLLLLILYNIVNIDVNMPSNLYFLDNYFVYSNFIQNIKAYIIFLSIIFFIFLYCFVSLIIIPIFEYIILILIIILSLCLMISSNNLFYIFLFLEIINLSFYVLIGLNKYSNRGIEIAYKYFIQSSFATLIGLFGVSIIYIKTGTLFLSELKFILGNFPIDNLIILSFLLIFITFFFKLGLFPLHN
jgi:NADH-quinone oxidoreductase subunit N